MNPALPWIAAPVVAGAFLALIWLERRRPLRRRVEPDLRHGARNFAIATISALALAAFEYPLLRPLADLVERQRWGMLGALELPGWVETGVALLLMDYTFYLWHVFLHRVPFLWRFHAVHHVDLDMDASTAFRFHFGEMIASVPWRAMQVLLIGLTPGAFVLWQAWFVLCVMFHHSNLRLPVAWEPWINVVLVTPRMHGIHHSQVREETDSNWSSGLTVWDRLHGTLRLNVPQSQIVVGVPPLSDPNQLTLLRALALPFGEQPHYWSSTDGTSRSPSIDNSAD